MTLVLAVPARHALAKRSELQLTNLKDEPFLLLDESTRTGEQIRSFFRTHGFVPQHVIDSGSFEVIKRYVAEGIGIAILPEAVLTPGDRRIVARPIPGLPSTEIGVVTRRAAYRSRAAEIFLEGLLTP